MCITSDNCRNSYKIDKQTEKILPILEDAHNHCIDSLRYAMEGRRRHKTTNTDPIEFDTYY